jgi:hypothetical protein
MRAALAGMAIATLLLGCSKQPAALVSIPFVGCPADGQVGPLDAPQGSSKVVIAGEAPEGEIAYYKGQQAPGVFAPRGWHCRVWYGSSGGSLVVTAAPIDSPPFPPPTFKDEAIEMSLSLGGTSGRFAAAEHAFLFPGAPSAILQGLKEVDDLMRIDDAPRQPSPGDIIKSDGLVAEFTTPSNQKGLGSERLLEPSTDPITGIAVLRVSEPNEPPDLIVFRARLGSQWRRLEKTILKLNRTCMQQRDGC